MTATKRRIVKSSPVVREYFNSLSEELKSFFCITLLVPDENETVDMCDDTIFVGDDVFWIGAVDDGSFFISTALTDPVNPLSIEEIRERYEQAIDDIKSGMPKELTIPAVHISCYYGKYVATCEEVVTTAISWLTFDPRDIPKEYDQPHITPR